MKQEGLSVPARKRRRYGPYLGEISPAPDNLLNRAFQAATPNEKWLTDITEFQIPAGKVYLSPVIDCFDGMVLSWTLGTRPDAELVNTMLVRARGNPRRWLMPACPGPAHSSMLPECGCPRCMSPR